jgi:P27 family predicted phage terminase small subunit
MANPRKPASLKKGLSETKAQLSVREEAEKKLIGNSDLINDVPEELDELAQAYYKFLVTELEISGLLSNLDITLLAETAQCMSQLYECNEILKKEGLLYYSFDKDGNSIPKEHPTVKTQNMLRVTYRAFANQLGLSPAARASLAGMQVEKKEEEADPLLQLLKGSG